MQLPEVLIVLSSTRVRVSALSTHKVLIELSSIRVLVSPVSWPRFKGYIGPNVVFIAILYFISTIILLNIIRLLSVY